MNKKPYIPSSGTEGMRFEAMWCDECNLHSISPAAKKQCIHLLKALLGQNNGHWWRRDDVETYCDAFKSREEANAKRRARNRVKDERQMELWIN